MEVQLEVSHAPIEHSPAVDAAVCGVAVDERPLKGPAGRLDWRLCGLLSRYLIRERYTGKLGEDMLVTTVRRLPFQGIFLFGLGRTGEIDASLSRQLAARCAGVLLKAGVDSTVLGIWDLTRERISFEEGLEAFLIGCSRAKAHGSRAESLHVRLLARNPAESGRMSHALDRRIEKPGPEGVRLVRASADA